MGKERKKLLIPIFFLFVAGVFLLNNIIISRVQADDPLQEVLLFDDFNRSDNSDLLENWIEGNENIEMITLSSGAMVAPSFIDINDNSLSYHYQSPGNYFVFWNNKNRYGRPYAYSPLSSAIVYPTKYSFSMSPHQDERIQHEIGLMEKASGFTETQRYDGYTEFFVPQNGITLSVGRSRSAMNHSGVHLYVYKNNIKTEYTGAMYTSFQYEYGSFYDFEVVLYSPTSVQISISDGNIVDSQLFTIDPITFALDQFVITDTQGGISYDSQTPGDYILRFDDIEVLSNKDSLICGNGVVEEGEECDDGNNINGDGCSDSCLFEETEESTINDITYYFSGQFMDSFGNLSERTPFCGSFLYDGSQPLNTPTHPYMGMYGLKDIVLTINEETVFGEIQTNGLIVFDHDASGGYPPEPEASESDKRVTGYPFDYLIISSRLSGTLGGIELDSYDDTNISINLMDLSGAVFDSPAIPGNDLHSDDFLSDGYMSVSLDVFNFDVDDGDRLIINGEIAELSISPIPSCTLGTISQCSDGIDNDNDGLVDMDDLDCFNDGDNYEGGNLPVTLSFVDEYGFEDGVGANTINTGESVVAKVIYTDIDNFEHPNVKFFNRGSLDTMIVDTEAPEYLRDGNYVNGEQFIYSGVRTYEDRYDYYFKADDYYTDEYYLGNDDGLFYVVNDSVENYIPSDGVLIIRDDVTGGDCLEIGVWDNGNAVCTMNRDYVGRIFMATDNITLDGDGYELRYEECESTYGVQNSIISTNRTSGVTIKNINFYSCYFAIKTNYSNHWTIENNQFYSLAEPVNGLTSSGIYLYGRNKLPRNRGHVIEDNYFDNPNGVSIWADTVEDIVVRRNTIEATRDIIISSVIGSYEITDNLVKNSENGFDFSASDYDESQGRINNNNFLVTSTGIRVRGASNCEFIGNKTTTDNINKNSYFLLQNVNNCLIINNEAHHNDGPGLWIEGDDNLIEKNYTHNVQGFGIYVKGIGNIIQSNVTNDNMKGGVSVYGDDNIISSNQIKNNNGPGIQATGERNSIKQNTIDSCLGGIYAYYYNNGSIRTNGIINNSGPGIKLENSYNNELYGMFVSGDPSVSSEGLYIKNSDNNQIENFNIENVSRGIVVESSKDNSIKNNYVRHASANCFYYIVDAQNEYIQNTLVHNNFIDCGTKPYASMGFYGLMPDVFLGTVEGGNYWSNYDESWEGCVDTDNDGFCDAPYYFVGNWNNVGDYKPYVSENYWLGGSENQRPVITIDPQIINWTLGDYFAEIEKLNGVSVSDSEDGNIYIGYDNVVGEVDYDAIGTYYLYYNVVDSLGLAAEEVVRTVIVGDAGEDPEIIDAPYNLESTYDSDNDNIYLTWLWSGSLSEIDGFKVFRKEWLGLTIELGQTGNNYFVDNNPPHNTRLTYSVKAYRGDIESEISDYAPGFIVDSGDKFTINDRIRVFDGPLNVRLTPEIISGNTIGSQVNGVIGTVVDGPVEASGYTWWEIDYDTGVDGWSAEDFIEKYVLGVGEVPGNFTVSLDEVYCDANEPAVRISWAESDGADSYYVYRSDTDINNFLPYANVGTDTEFVNEVNLEVGNTYFYQIKAINEFGETMSDNFVEAEILEDVCGVVQQPECNDGIDNDGDGLIDYPNDPGCESLDDDDEDIIIGENRPPDEPTNLIQKYDNKNVEVGGIINLNSIHSDMYYFATISDLDGDKVRLQIQTKYFLGFDFGQVMWDILPNENSLFLGDLVDSGDTFAISDVIIGSYRWRARTIDEHGLTSDWVDFGDNHLAESDFEVSKKFFEVEAGKIIRDEYLRQNDYNFVGKLTPDDRLFAIWNKIVSEAEDVYKKGWQESGGWTISLVDMGDDGVESPTKSFFGGHVILDQRYKNLPDDQIAFLLSREVFSIATGQEQFRVDRISDGSIEFALFSGTGAAVAGCVVASTFATPASCSVGAWVGVEISSGLSMLHSATFATFVDVYVNPKLQLEDEKRMDEYSVGFMIKISFNIWNGIVFLENKRNEEGFLDNILFKQWHERFENILEYINERDIDGKYNLNLHGYSFKNKGVKTDNPATLINEGLTDTSKLIIFNDTFDLSGVDSNSINLWKNYSFGESGNCYGMSVSSLMEYKYPKYDQFLENEFKDSLERKYIVKLNEPSVVKTWYPSYLDRQEEIDAWNGNGDIRKKSILEHIIRFQLSWHGIPEKLKIVGIGNVLNTLKTEFPQKMYILTISDKGLAHALIPFRLETVIENQEYKIFVYDPNHPNNEEYAVIIKKDWRDKWSWKYNLGDDLNPRMWSGPSIWKIFGDDSIKLIPISVAYNNGDRLRLPGTNNTNEANVFSFGNVNFLLVDSEGRMAGFKDNSFVEEIPNVELIFPISALSNEEPKKWQPAFYISNDTDLKFVVEKSVDNEEFSFVKFGNGYFVEFKASAGAEDSKIDISQDGTSISISGQEDKYNLFFNKNIGGVSQAFTTTDIPTTPSEVHQYSIDWQALSQNEEGITVRIDQNGDGEFERTIMSDATLEASEIAGDNSSSASNTGSTGGGGLIQDSIVENSISASEITDDSAVINWRTPMYSSSKVVFSSEDESREFDPNNHLNYGYADFTEEDLAKVTGHKVALTGLKPGTTYYYRCVSAYFPKVVSQEHSFTTKGEKIEILGVEYVDTSDIDSLYGFEKYLVDLVSLQEAKEVYNYNEPIELTEENLAIFNKLIKDYELSEEDKNSIAYFIQPGTKTTKRLGAGERAGVLNSYVSAFKTLPESVLDWQDVIKIANGRWPGKINTKAKTKALEKFTKVYTRVLDENNQYDDAAITIMAYGLRPANRNLDSERFAIKIFENIFKYNPESATDWDLVRAIAYSGSER